MVTDLRPLATGLSNADWLNAIRNVSGSEYQMRVPEATQANIQDVVQKLWQYPAGRNAFVDALINKIGLTVFANTSWSNPLAVYKRGFLNFGETIEEIMVGLLKATNYDPERDELEKEIFGRSRPEVQVNYHHVDRQDRYKLTIDEPQLNMAFFRQGGLNTFVTNLMNSIQTSDQNDEYLIMANLFKEFDEAAGDQGIHTVHVDDVGNEGSDGPASRFMLRQLRKYSNVLPFISRLYNPAGMPVAARPEELVLFVTADADAAMDVEALAAAFNITKAEFGSRKIVLPTDDFGIPGVQAILTTDKFFVCADKRIETTSIQNPAGLFNNYWLHHWGVYSASRFAPFVMFNSERPSTVINRTATPVTGIGTITVIDELGATQATNVKRNAFYNVTAQAVTNPAGGSNDAVRYAITGNTSSFTKISNEGVLYIAPDESATSISIQIISVDDDTVKATASRNIVGTYIRPWPDPVVTTDVDSDNVEEPILTADTFKMVSGKVRVPDPTEGYTVTRVIKEGVTFTDAGDVVGVPKHGAVAGDTVVFGAITGTTGITAATTYYVKDVINADSFTIAATAGGAILPLTTNGTAVSATLAAKDGKNYTIGGLTDFVAAADSGFEIAAGSVTTWTFDN